MSNVSKGQANALARAVERFDAWATASAVVADGETPDQAARREACTARRLVAELLAAGAALPNRLELGDPLSEEGADVGPTTAEWEAVYRRMSALPFQHYSCVEPGAEDAEDLGVGDLHDDLADIWRDVREGLEHWRAGRPGDALFHWHSLFRVHWGAHAADALRELHARLRGHHEGAEASCRPDP